MTRRAENLIKRAEDGEHLTVKERRQAIAYLLSTDRTPRDAKGYVIPNADQNDEDKCSYATNVAKGELFGVSERQIRLDCAHLREERSQMVRSDDISLVIADIALSFERQVMDIEKSKRFCALGGRTYLEHCKSIFNLQLEKVKALQALGYYPKNLGNLTVEEFSYTASVGVMVGDGTAPQSIESRRQALEENDDFTDVEFSAVTHLLAESPAPQELRDLGKE